MAEVDDARHTAGIHAHLESVLAPVDQRVQFSNARIRGREDVLRLAQPDGFVQQEYYAVNAGREIILAQPLDGFVNGVVSQHVVDVCLDPAVQQHADRPQCVIVAVPADRHRAAVLFAQAHRLRGEPKTGGGVVGDDVVLAAHAQDVRDALVLVGVAPAAQGELIDPAAALPGDILEILQRHVGLLDRQPALIAADPRFDTQTGLAVIAVPHNADIDQVRVGCHEGIHPGVQPLPVEDAGAHVRAGLGIEDGDEVVFVVDDFLVGRIHTIL